MCGICGFVGSSASEYILQAMCATIVHRGPDDSGYFYETGRVALGMRRLSIIDVSGGGQPIFSERRDVAVVFNGEIYNFARLRDDLRAKGHHFTTRADTEVIVHGYEEYGLQVFEKLDGMFGIALWDRRQQRLIVARDRIGIKPVYYAWVNGSFVFASEIKPITLFPGFEAQLDLVALDGYLTYQYVPAPLTLFKGVRKLRPGHLLIIEPGKLNAQERPFWQFHFEQPGRTRSDAQWIDLLEETLDAAVRSHLVSDVPLGAFLSGGVDSSTIVALMARAMNRPVKTFSVGFAGKNAKNELSHAQTVAHHLHTDHHALMVTPDMVRDLPALIWHMDEPLGDPAALPTFFVAKLAKERGVTVALSGEGADEMFAGYTKYRLDRYLRLYQGLPARLRRTLLSLLSRLPHFERHRRLLTKTASISTTDERVIAWRKVGFPDHYRARLLTRDLQAEVDQHAQDLVRTHLADTGHLTALQKMLQLDTLSWLPDDLLMKVDRMSMAASVEARVPYLDNRVVGLAESMPDRLKLRGRATKYALKAVARKLLPPFIVERPKHGFELPLDEWIRDELGVHFRSLLLDGPVANPHLFDQAYINNIITAHRASKADHGARIWLLANLALWLDRFAVKV